MGFDRSFVELNRASVERMRALAQLSDAELQTAVGEHWTAAIVLAHLAFWDRRVMYVLDKMEATYQLFIPEIDTFVNDLFLPFWQALPPREAARISLGDRRGARCASGAVLTGFAGRSVQLQQALGDPRATP